MQQTDNAYASPGIDIGNPGKTPTRDELLSLLSSRVKDATLPPQYWTPAAALLAELSGFKRTTDKSLKSPADLFSAWKSEQDKDLAESMHNSESTVSQVTATDKAS